MAQGFKLDTKNEFEEFAKEFTDAVGVEMGRKHSQKKPKRHTQARLDRGAASAIRKKFQS